MQCARSERKLFYIFSLLLLQCRHSLPCHSHQESMGMHRCNVTQDETREVTAAARIVTALLWLAMAAMVVLDGMQMMGIKLAKQQQEYSQLQNKMEVSQYWIWALYQFFSDQMREKGDDDGGRRQERREVCAMVNGSKIKAGAPQMENFLFW